MNAADVINAIETFYFYNINKYNYQMPKENHTLRIKNYDVLKHLHDILGNKYKGQFMSIGMHRQRFGLFLCLINRKFA